MGERSTLENNSDKYFEYYNEEFELLPSKSRMSKKKSTRVIINDENVLNGKGKKHKHFATSKNINMIEYWLHFKKKLLEDKRFKMILKNEKSVLSKSILNVQNIF